MEVTSTIMTCTIMEHEELEESEYIIKASLQYIKFDQ